SGPRLHGGARGCPRARAGPAGQPASAAADVRNLAPGRHLSQAARRRAGRASARDISRSAQGGRGRDDLAHRPPDGSGASAAQSLGAAQPCAAPRRTLRSRLMLRAREGIRRYAFMKLAREFDARFEALLLTGRVAKWYSAIGNEAITVPAGLALERGDVLCSL